MSRTFCDVCHTPNGETFSMINGSLTCDICVKAAMKWYEKKNRYYEVKDELSGIIRKRNNELEYVKRQLSKYPKYYRYFFEYFLGYHAILCDDKGCVCRASTFMDLICEPELRNSKEYGKDIEEVLARD